MEGTITNFRGGRHTKYNNQMIIKINDIDKKEKTKEVIGKKVIWQSPAGKKITGKISNLHGNSGCVRAIFEKGMPGQAISQKVKIE
ncbi:MAG: 50S ribosomal protein L35ae [Candidatus Woesearchaeota archaeon]